MTGDAGQSPFGGPVPDGPVAVLYVGDEPGGPDSAATSLERESDRLSVETADSAEAGLQRLEQGAFDCVVSEYGLPGTDGLAVLPSVREEHPDLPFVLFPDEGSEEVASRAISAGVTDYIRKDAGSDQYAVLANRIEHAVDRHRSERALASSRRRLSLFVEQSHLGVIEWDDDFEVAGANPAAREILGYEADELRGRSWETLVPPDERKQVGENFDRLLEGIGGFTSRNENVTKEGDRIICEWHNRVVTDDDGEAVGVFSQFRDVTEREEYSRRLETLISNLPGIAYRCRNEPAWPMEFVAGECEALTGYPVEAIEEGGDVLWGEDVLHPEDRERAWEAVQAAVDDREPFEMEYRIRTADDEIRWMWERGRGVYTADGELEALEGFITDVTERERRERRLQGLQRRTRELMYTTSDADTAGVAVDAAREVLGAELGGVQLVDDEGERLVPVAVDDELADLLGEPPVYERDADDPVAAVIWDVFESGEALKFEDTADVDRLAGETPVASGILHPLGDHGVLVVTDTEPGAFDDTDRALVEILATTLTAALDRTDRESLLRERERQLERENDRLDAFASAVSHDLRNPLNVAAGNVELAMDEHDDETLREAAAALDRMEGLIADLLTLAREGESIGERAPVDVGTVARDCTTRVGTEGASVEVAADVTVSADRSRLAQLIENLLANAVDHGGESITVGALDDAGFYVADDGPGIPPEDRGRVFEAGYTTGDGGAGLGLSIVRDVAEGHGWSVSVVESAAGGARFEVRTGA